MYMSSIIHLRAFCYATTNKSVLRTCKMKVRNTNNITIYIFVISLYYTNSGVLLCHEKLICFTLLVFDICVDRGG